MAKEVKSVDVHPNAEASTVEIFQTFGWEFHSTQEVVSNYQERHGDDLYQVREQKIKLTFQRERNMPNYRELVELEKTYYAIPDAPYPPSRFGLMWLIISAIGLFAYVVPGVLIIIWRFVRYSKKYPEWERLVETIRARENEILQRAEALLE